MAEKVFTEDTEKLLLISLRKIISTIDRHSRHLIKSYGLTIPQLLILQEVISSKGSTVSKLGKVVTLSQPTVTDIVERLQSRGFLTRYPSGTDKRSNIIISTEKGIELMKKKTLSFPSVISPGVQRFGGVGKNINAFQSSEDGRHDADCRL